MQEKTQSEMFEERKDAALNSPLMAVIEKVVEVLAREEKDDEDKE